MPQLEKLQTDLEVRNFPAPTGGRRFDRASMALFGVTAAIILITFRQYGITWDEPLQMYHGTTVGRFYWLFVTGHYLPYEKVLIDGAWYQGLNHYGGLFDAVGAALSYASPFGRFETWHLFSALCGWLGVVGCWRIARRIGGPQSGFWTALLMTITPRYYGAMFNNLKDVPFAAAYIWSIDYLLQMAEAFPRPSRGLLLKTGVAIGVTIGARVGGLLLLLYLGLMALLWAVVSLRRGEGWGPTMAVGRAAVFVTIVAWLAMLPGWPWLYGQPLLRPFQALFGFANNYPWDGNELFQGAFYRANKLPLNYLPTWLWISLPEIVLAGLVVGAIVAIVSVTRRPHLLLDLHWRRCGLLALSSAFPLVYAMATRPALYDAARHFLFLIPPLVCLCGITLTEAISWLRRRGSIGPMALHALVGAYLVYHVSVMIRLHPDEYVYVNQTIGGLPGAFRNYETDYWGNSYREATLRLADFVKQQGLGGQQFRVMAESKRESSSYYFPPEFAFTRKPEEADFFLSTTRDRLDESVDGLVLFAVERFGVPLCIVKDRRALKGTRPPAWRE
jgi:hypothetical protein